MRFARGAASPLSAWVSSRSAWITRSRHSAPPTRKNRSRSLVIAVAMASGADAPSMPGCMPLVSSTRCTISCRRRRSCFLSCVTPSSSSCTSRRTCTNARRGPPSTIECSYARVSSRLRVFTKASGKSATLCRRACAPLRRHCGPLSASGSTVDPVACMRATRRNTVSDLVAGGRAGAVVVIAATVRTVSSGGPTAFFLN
ncbi:hypothetical protein PybrP1_002318 [[Pythium] brassicae (nom. inval.)]|nr:hypothetical protein PybrP1_002318 [[Pythium] brassicae (nom. inval.)]